MSFRTRTGPRLLALLCGAALWIAPSAFAADGDLDPTFNGTGIVVTNGAPWEEAYDLVIQPDGKIVVAGDSTGALDPTFGSGGVVTTTVGNSRAYAVAVQPDGRVVIAGSGNRAPDPDFLEFFADFVVVRYGDAPPPGPTHKDQCKNGGWQTFTNPSFKNQGDCISYVNQL